MKSQRDLFPSKAVVGYLNGASRAPQLKSVAAAARHAVWWREENPGMPIDDFFRDAKEIKQQFARLVHCSEPQRVALIPSASYGIATAAKNLPLGYGQKIIVVEDQFPSNYYAWEKLCSERGGQLEVVKTPGQHETDSWTDRVLAAIDTNTAAVAIAQVHWADGTLFNLEAIRTRADEVNAWLIVDATQSIGAYPFNVEKIRPDALIAAGYKWLMGPYGCGYAYFGERMDEGSPIEENWINRTGSSNFRNLSRYTDAYRPYANRYSVGEHSNFIMSPMQLAALQQVNAWGADGIQEYCSGLWDFALPTLRELGITVADERAHHLVGLRLPAHLDLERAALEIKNRGLHVSFRGDNLRVSPNVYNTPDDMANLNGALLQATK